MRTEIEALKEIHDRISYFCSRTDGKYDPPWAQEVIGIIDDVLTTPLNQEAHRRELSKNTSKNRADFGQLGDAAKLREALKHIKDRLPHMLQYMRVHWEDASAGGYFDELMLVINAALSTPPRNCDLPEVAKDPWRAWLDDESNWEDGNPKLEIHDWLFAPATEKEGGAK